MPNNNGNGKYWVRYLVGTLFTILLIIITTIGNNVIANDKASRTRDEKLHDKDAKMKEDFNTYCMAQQTINEKLSVSLAKIQTDIGYIKQKVQ